MNSAIRLMASAGVVAALAWSTGLAVPASAVAGTGASGDVFGSLDSVSCPSFGNCSAVGTFGPLSRSQAFVMNQAQGSWTPARHAPGPSSLPGAPAQYSELLVASCPLAGNCGAGGYYVDNRGNEHALVVDEKNGTWGNARVIDTSHLKGSTSVFTSLITVMSCRSAGNCTAAGWYQAQAIHSVFVLTERDGTWGPAENLPGTASLAFQNPGVTSLSCASPGDCAIGGQYGSDFDNIGNQEAFVATETNGAWGRLQEVPGTAAVNKRVASANSVSCTSGGNCVAVGYYQDEKYRRHPFFTTRAHRVWSPIQTIPDLASLPTGGAATASVDLVWCASAGYCTAVGDYVDKRGTPEIFSVTERNGTWGKPVKMHIGARLPVVSSMSCTSLANCGAGGEIYFKDGSHGAFVINKKNGVWGTAEQVPGLNKIDQTRHAYLYSVSCAAAGDCVAGGVTVPRFAHDYPFITTETAGTWGDATVPALP